MIDSHCHLESPDYEKDLDEVIQACKKGGLRALITVCAEPADWPRTLELIGKYRGYVFACAALHPIYIDRIPAGQIDAYFALLKQNRDVLAAIGETGADYFHVTDEGLREKQRELFRRHISLAKELDKPVVVHCRDAFDDVIKILEDEGARRVMMHLFGGHKFTHRVIRNGWWISAGPILLKSKAHKKIIRDVPLGKIMLETDSPWFGVNGQRNTPLSVAQVAERIAEIKKAPVDHVSDITDKNAAEFFSLPLAPIF